MLSKIDYRDSFRETKTNIASYYDEKDCDILMNQLYDSTSSEVYSQVRQKLAKILSNGLDSKEQVDKVTTLLKSKYKLEQTFPKIKEVVIKEGIPNYKQKEQEVWAAANEQVTSENNGKKPTANAVKKRVYVLLNKPVLGAVRVGDFSNDFFPSMRQKHTQLGVEEYGKLGFSTLLIHSADGCKHNTGKKEVPIITANEQVFSLEVQQKGISTANSCQLFTYLQVQSEEKRDVVIQMFKEHFESKNKFLENAEQYFGEKCKVYSYECHNMKFLHILYGNVGWNSDNGGFLLCGCNRKEGKHQCKIIDDDTHKKLYKKARSYFQRLLTSGRPEHEAIKLTNQWAAMNNCGVNGLGIDPKLLPLSRVRFDVMHLSMNVT